jgi:hypothetical protein
MITRRALLSAAPVALAASPQQLTELLTEYGKIFEAWHDGGDEPRA